MKKRIFIAINLPDEIKRTLLQNERRWKNLNVRWASFYNMHITMEFLGEVDRLEVESILLAAEKAAEKVEQFTIRLDRITLGPTAKEPTMFWVTIMADGGISKLKEMLDEELMTYNFDLQKRQFMPHITLARARGNQLKGKKTNVHLKGMKFTAEGIEVIESQLHKEGALYKTIESFAFKKQDVK